MVNLFERLRKAGCQVKVQHCRLYNRLDASRCTVLSTEPINRGHAENCGFKPDHLEPRGGLTLVSVITPDGQEFEAEARCSDKDAYNRRLGREIALGRLVKTDGLSALISQS